MRFAKKIAVVTGAGRGLGRDVALAMSAEGATVVLIGRNIEPLRQTLREVQSQGGEAHCIVANVADADSIDSCAKEVLQRYGQVDILVNNAAIGGPSAPLWELDLAEWQETFDINTTGPFLCCRAFLPSMIERQTGSIVLVGSMTGKRPLLNRTAYAASKIALVGMLRTLAWETGPHGIRVNMVSPGPMEGERMKWVLKTQAEDQNITVEEARNSLTSNSPTSSFVESGHVVAAITYLLSDEAKSTTGEDLNISAGICMY